MSSGEEVIILVSLDSVTAARLAEELLAITGENASEEPSAGSSEQAR